jgi:hypothetical protein
VSSAAAITAVVAVSVSFAAALTAAVAAWSSVIRRPERPADLLELFHRGGLFACRRHRDSPLLVATGQSGSSSRWRERSSRPAPNHHVARAALKRLPGVHEHSSRGVDQTQPQERVWFGVAIRPTIEQAAKGKRLREAIIRNDGPSFTVGARAVQWPSAASAVMSSNEEAAVPVRTGDFQSAQLTHGRARQADLGHRSRLPGDRPPTLATPNEVSNRDSLVDAIRRSGVEARGEVEQALGDIGGAP